MAAIAIKEQQLKIDSFLGKQMMQNNKTKEEVLALRTTECAEVTIQGDNIKTMTVEELEKRFEQQQEQPGAANMITIPSTDILQWKASFPLQETSEQVLAELHTKYKEMFQEGKDKIKQEEVRIDKELLIIGNGQDVKQTANKIADMVEGAVIVDPTTSVDSPVRKKLRRELEGALEGKDKKTRLLKVLYNILHEGIDNFVRKVNKTKWGMLVNRRGQVGENKTVAAINQAVDGFVGISVMGMKTHSYLHDFLSKLDIQMTYMNTRDPVTGKVKKTNEVEHDFIMTYLESNCLTVTMVESKTREFKPWAVADQTENTKAAVEHAKKALQQLLKDFITFKEIFPDLTKTMLTSIRFQYFVALSDVTEQDWPSDAPSDHIIFKEDIEDISRLQSKLKLPSTPPDPSTISSIIRKLHCIIGARYVGGASLINLKTPQEGFPQQKTLLKKIRTGYERQIDKVFMMGREQQAVFQAGLSSYCNFGGHGSGKTVLLQSNIRRDVQKIVADQEKTTQHLLIICIWQKGADALLSQYRELATDLPKANNLEVIVVTKEELMKRFKANIQEIEATATTHQINTVCHHIDSLVLDKQVHLYIDELWVTVPKMYSAHLTMANPNDVVGHIPFIRNGVLYPWSKLNPGQVKLSVAIMPDCQHLLEKDLITAPPPQQGPVFTVFAPRSFRTTMRIHALIQHIQVRVEMDLRVWRYLLPPKDEKVGHEIMGSLPVWQRVKQTDHFICQIDDCDQCYLKNVTKPLLSHFNETMDIHGAKPEDIVFILSKENSSTRTCTDAIPAMQYLRQKFPGVDIKFDDEFEGMEKAVVVNLTNGSIGTSPSIIPVSLTRANSHLVMFCEDFRNILKDATDKGLIKESKRDIQTSLDTNTPEVQLPVGLTEATDTMCNLARKLSFDSIKNLAQEWGVLEKYLQLQRQEKTRFQMIRLMYQKKMEDTPFATMAQFIESIRVVNMSEAVTSKMAENLKSNIDELNERITAKHLTDNEQIELAHSLGKRELFNSLTQPEDLFLHAVSDQVALKRCLESWMCQAQETTTEGLMRTLQIAGLSRICTALRERQSNHFEGASYENMSIQEQVKTTALEVFLPLITAILTVAYMVVLFSKSLNTLLFVLLCLHWIPSAVLQCAHVFFNSRFFGSSMNNPKWNMLVLLVCQPVGSIILHITYLLKRARSTGIEIERYKMEKIFRLAEVSVLMNNFTSLLVIFFTLHLANNGTISEEDPALLSVSAVTLVLHLVKLFFHILKKQTSGELSWEVVEQIGLVSFPVASSVILKLVSLVILLSSASSYAILFGCVMFVLAMAVNWWLEKKFLTDETEDEEKKTFLRAAHSLIFPLAPQLHNRKQVLGLNLQLLVGNVAAATLGFSSTLIVGVSKELFITQNIAKAFCMPIAFLIAFSSLAYHGMSLLTRCSEEPLPTDDFEEDIESTPLLGNPNRPAPKTSLKKAAYATVLLVMSMLILSSWYPLLLYQFNTCPPFSSTPNFHIKCDKTPHTYGSTCHLYCSPLSYSKSMLDSSCTLTGAWSVTDLTCRPQAAALVGRGWNASLGMLQQTVDMYPPSGSKSHIPGLPNILGSTAYIGGSLMYCGGYNIHDLSVTSLKSCYSLKSPEPRWKETFQLLQETKFPSTAVIEDGRAMLVMGGMQDGHNFLPTTQIVRHGQPTEPGPNMTEWAAGHCSTTLQDGSVVITGGRRKSNHAGSAMAEVYNFTTGQWRQVQNMKQGRFFHSCTQVWLSPDDPDSDILSSYVTNTSIISIVVAGGVHLDGAALQPTTSVELYLPWNDTWINLPTLPDIKQHGTVLPVTDTLIMSLAIAGGSNSLHLVGGVHQDWNTGASSMTSNVWRLLFHIGNHSYYWDDRYTHDMDIVMSSAVSKAVGVPDTFFGSFTFREG